MDLGLGILLQAKDGLMIKAMASAEQRIKIMGKGVAVSGGTLKTPESCEGCYRAGNNISHATDQKPS